MNTETKLERLSKSLDETIKLGVKLGANLKGHETIELSGDIGTGKTSLVRGIAKGVGSDDEVASPSFTISRIYKSKNAILNHYDFYRLTDPGIMKNELQESVESNDIVLVEWGGIVEGVLPKDRLRVEIKPGENEDDRLFEISAGPGHKHLLNGLEL